MGKKSEERRICERKSVEAPIEIIPEEDKLVAISQDLSSSGVQFTTKGALRIWIRMKSQDDFFAREAELVWAKKEEDGSMKYGFKFVN